MDCSSLIRRMRQKPRQASPMCVAYTGFDACKSPKCRLCGASHFGQNGERTLRPKAGSSLTGSTRLTWRMLVLFENISQQKTTLQRIQCDKKKLYLSASRDLEAVMAMFQHPCNPLCSLRVNVHAIIFGILQPIMSCNGPSSKLIHYETLFGLSVCVASFRKQLCAVPKGQCAWHD